MSLYDINDIKNRIFAVMDQKRYEHTMGVAYTCASLAMRYADEKDGLSMMNRAFVAGLLHDNAKCMDSAELLDKCILYNIPVSKAQKENPFLLHGPLGAYYARTEYNICDEEIINSIIWHTTGRPNMSLLEKIVFVADYIEPSRTKQPNLSELRALAFTDIDKCIYRISEDTLMYLNEHNMPVDETTVATRDYYGAVRRDGEVSPPHS